jgi:adenylate kinase
MFRLAAAEGTPMGLMAKEIMERGDLVPDDVTVGIVRDRLAQPDAKSGVVLDGFPRTKAQAEALDALLGERRGHGRGLDLVLNIGVPTEVARARMLERARVEGRADDTEEAIDRRLELYEEMTRPLLEYYGDRVATVDGVGSIDDVFERCIKEIEAA